MHSATVPSCGIGWLPNKASGGNFVENLSLAPKSLSRKNIAKKENTAKDRTNPLFLALEMKELLDSGEFSTKSEIARRYGWSRARVTQIMSLLKLPKEVQAVLMDPKNQKIAVSERGLRRLLKAETFEEREQALATLGLCMASKQE